MKRLRRLAAILMLTLFLALSVYATVTFSQYLGYNETASVSSNTPVNLGTITGVGAGHVLVVWFVTSSPIATTTVSAPTDTFGLTYTSIQAAFNNFTNAGQMSGWCALTGNSSGSDTVSVAYSPSAALFSRAFIVEYAGATCQTDGSATSGVNSASSCTAGPITTTVANDLLTAMAYMPSQTGTAWTAGGAWTRRSLSTALRTGIEDQLNVAVGSYSQNMSWTTANATACAIVALKPQAAASKFAGPLKIVGPTKVD
jgi:hypothetical protein